MRDMSAMRVIHGKIQIEIEIGIGIGIGIGIETPWTGKPGNDGLQPSPRLSRFFQARRSRDVYGPTMRQDRSNGSGTHRCR